MGPSQGHRVGHWDSSSVSTGPGQRMLLFWGSLLCWGLLPQAQGEAQHLLFLQISKEQLRTGKRGGSGWGGTEIQGKARVEDGITSLLRVSLLASQSPAAEFAFLHPDLAPTTLRRTSRFSILAFKALYLKPLLPPPALTTPVDFPASFLCLCSSFCLPRSLPSSQHGEF